VDQLDRDNKANLCKKGLSDDIRYTGLYKRLQQPQNLKYAYDLISKKKGANTKGVENTTLDGYSNETIKSLSESFKNHSFKFKPIRRVHIPKRDGSKRPLGIPGPRDKVVQKAATIELENIFENIFENSSHGFRPKRGTHTALKEISGWAGTK
jgi:retron-type reverse transcriptase